MRAQGGGHIVDIISGIAFFPDGLPDDVLRHQGRAERADPCPALRALGREHPPDLGHAGHDGHGDLGRERSEAPPGAQSPEQSAQTILAGVAKNERLVLGDEGDASGARYCFNPEAAKEVDDYLLNVARKRRSGEWVV